MLSIVILAVGFLLGWVSAKIEVYRRLRRDPYMMQGIKWAANKKREQEATI